MLNSSVFFEHRAGAPEYPPHGLYGGGGQGTDDLPPGGPGPELPPPEYGHSDARFIRIFGGLYAIIAVATLLWGLISYQRRVTLIKQKYGGPLGEQRAPRSVRVEKGNPSSCSRPFDSPLPYDTFALTTHRA